MPGTEPGKSGQPVLLWVYLVLAPLTTPPFILAAALCRGDVISPILQVRILRPGKQVTFWQSWNSESVS